MVVLQFGGFNNWFCKNRIKDDINAALHVARKSAPEQLFVSFATHRKVASAGGFGVHFEVWHFKISNRASSLGNENKISRSNRPGRRNAGSMASGLFVAPMTMTCPRSETPSIKDNKVVTTDA